ncbi:hypothetical protein [Maribacter sp. ACAM166]|uniref:hypothetical protein n=1 Tax=Maribacter sp. ACAM166 TaxID=2508996 RepID=UPI0010FF5910|nr:hypothetical protein [Maribacter sp. ACAM166]TLP81727.1 hypothetical protein ES765_03310 [Maribacter sp. ACAM166]
MAFEELKQDLTEAEVDVRSYLENSAEYLKLKVFKVLMGLVTTMAQGFLIAAIVILALFIPSLGVSLALNELLGSLYLGFIITGAFYILITIICFVFRDSLNKSLLRKFSKLYFD